MMKTRILFTCVCWLLSFLITFSYAATSNSENKKLDNLLKEMTVRLSHVKEHWTTKGEQKVVNQESMDSGEIDLF